MGNYHLIEDIDHIEPRNQVLKHCGRRWVAIPAATTLSYLFLLSNVFPSESARSSVRVKGHSSPMSDYWRPSADRTLPHLGYWLS
jgi:hypothetical protein